MATTMLAGHIAAMWLFTQWIFSSLLLRSNNTVCLRMQYIHWLTHQIWFTTRYFSLHLFKYVCASRPNAYLLMRKRHWRIIEFIKIRAFVHCENRKRSCYFAVMSIQPLAFARALSEYNFFFIWFIWISGCVSKNDTTTITTKNVWLEFNDKITPYLQ